MEKDFVESDIPGKIIASFRVPNTLQQVHERDNELQTYCKMLQNNEKINFQVEDWKNLLSSEDIEEVVGLYLQVVKNLYIYTSTCKFDTNLIEFQLTDKNGKLYGVQVKSGDTSINANDYLKISTKMKIYLFAVSDNIYNFKKNKNIEKINSQEITEFIKKYFHILPNKIKLWFKNN